MQKYHKKIRICPISAVGYVNKVKDSSYLKISSTRLQTSALPTGLPKEGLRN